MVILDDISDCCGCSACANICPKQCVRMIPDQDGFFYPSIDNTICVNCNICVSVCPVKNKISNSDSIIDSYVVQNRNEQDRSCSTSGGFFASVAQYVIENEGVVFAPSFGEGLTVKHTEITNTAELELALGSKYVQSEVGRTYLKAKNYLNQGRLVCFAGTPCQIEGLLRFLNNTPPNLITIGVVCHGVPSPKVWKKFLDETEKHYKKQITYVNFRDKTLGYNRSGVKLFFEDGSEKVMTPPDIYLSTFFAEICSRPSCYKCKFKEIGRLSDFTIFDAWHAEDKVFDLDANGSTNVFVNTQNGASVLKNIESKLKLKKVGYEKAISEDGIMILNSAVPNPNRKKFFDDLDQCSLKQLQRKYYPMSLKKYMKYVVKDVLNSFGILERINGKGEHSG